VPWRIGDGGLPVGYPRRMRTRCLLLALLAACSPVEESKFATELAVVECRRIKACARGEFESVYAGKMNDCVDSRGESLDEVVEGNREVCEFDADQATLCVRRVDGMRCEDWAEGDGARVCDLVFDCSDPKELSE
jgi:hypothetical protein